MKEVTVKKYIAEDGTVFESEETCRMYEKFDLHYDIHKFLGDMNWIYTGADDVYPMGDYANGVLFIEIQNKEQEKRFKEWLLAHDFEFEDRDMVGKIFCADCYDGGNSSDGIEEIYDVCTVDELITKFVRNVTRFAKKLEENNI